MLWVWRLDSHWAKLLVSLWAQRLGLQSVKRLVSLWARPSD